MRRALITTEPKKLDYYHGLLIHADLGLHEQAHRSLASWISAGSSVLDVGAGAGAFSLRLADAGYDVTALDKEAGEWSLKDIRFLQVDIEEGIARAIPELFDAACCLEVIEHVENQWNLIRELNAVLKPGGYLVLSTPNIASFLSRLYFLRSGRFHQFFDQDLTYGHIHPIAPAYLAIMAARAGFEIIEMAPAGYLPVFDFSVISIHSILGNLMRAMAYCLAGNHKEGSCLIFVMKKATVQAVLADGEESAAR